MNVTPGPTVQSDSLSEGVTRRIINLLSQRGGPWLASVKVGFQSGTATLSGAVRSYHERQLCIACCQHTPGVYRVVDELEVDYPASAVISNVKSGND